MSNETELKFSLDNPSTTVHLIFAVLYAVIMVVGVTGNSLVIIVVRRNRSMHTTTNFLLVNLAAADIITLVWCPRLYSFSLTDIHPQGLLGDYICKIFTGNGVIGVTVASSVLTLTLLALERYHALVKPMVARLRLKREDTGKVVGFIWVVSILINIPDILANTYSEVFRKCVCPFSLEVVKETKAHVICTVVFLGILPFMTISYCYFQIMKGIYFSKTIIGEGTLKEDIEARKKLARLLLSVTVAFYICYLPYGSFWFIMVVVEKEYILVSQARLAVVLKLVEFLVVCSSCMNPVLYAFQSSNYREGFRRVCCLRIRRNVVRNLNINIPLSTIVNN